MIREFIYKYYIDPIRYGEPYSLVDTLTYAIVLIISLFLVYRWLVSRRIPLDRQLVLSTLPFVVLGGLLRVIEDTGMISSELRYLLVTPIIFFVVFLIAVLSLLLSHALSSHGVIADYHRIYAGIGVLLSSLCILALAHFGICCSRIGLVELLAIPSLACATSLALYLFLRHLLAWEYVSDLLYRILIFGHMLDASATSYGIDLHEVPYREVHVLGSALISLTGTGFSMFLLKLLVLVPAIFVLERYRQEGSAGFWHLVLLAMIVLGLAPGIRDMGRMVLFV